MNIVNFTPVSALSGGLLIGLSVALFFILNGRMIGISGIASNFINYSWNSSWIWNKTKQRLYKRTWN